MVLAAIIRYFIESQRYNRFHSVFLTGIGISSDDINARQRVTEKTGI